MSIFDSTKAPLPDIIREITAGKIQLPDFQRGWVWDGKKLTIDRPRRPDLSMKRQARRPWRIKSNPCGKFTILPQ